MTTKTSLDWQALSEITAGLLIAGRVPPSAVRSESLVDPFSAIPKLLAGRKIPSREKMIQAIGPLAFQAAEMAAGAVNGIPPGDWVVMLNEAASLYQAGVQMEKYAVKLKRGEIIDTSILKSLLLHIDQRDQSFVSLDKIEPSESDFVPSGWSPLDEFVGGLPQASTSLVLGAPGVGKTYIFCALAIAKAKQKQYTDLFSLEMTMGQLAKRLIDYIGVPRNLRKYIRISDRPMSVGDIVATVAQRDDTALFAVDFAEKVLDNDGGEMAASFMHRSLADAAKENNKEIVILAQQTKASVANADMPFMGAARYSMMADAMTALELGIYNPSAIFLGMRETTAPVTLRPGHGGLVVIKSRYGFKMGGPGVIEIPFRAEHGWGDRAVEYHRLGG